MGLYFKNIIPFFFLLILISKIKEKKLIILIWVIGICYILCLEKGFINIKNNIESGKYVVKIISEKQENNYTNKYTVKIVENEKLALKNRKLYILLSKDEKDLKIGDKIFIDAEKIQENSYKNRNQYDNLKYQQQTKIYGTLKVSKIIKIKESKFRTIKEYINKRLEELFDGDEKSVLFSIVLGNKNFITDKILNDFRKSGFSHIIAVSGMHIGYVVSSSEKLLRIFKIGKRESKVILIIILIFFYYIVGFTSSISRSIIMSILTLISSLIHKKKNTLNSLFISAFIILIYNPFLIENPGFILTYLGTIGVVEFEPLINKKVMKNKIYLKSKKEYIKYIQIYTKLEKEKIKIKDSKKSLKDKMREYIDLAKSTNSISIVEKRVCIKYKILSFLFENLSVSIAVNLFSIPASIYLFNSINLMSIISSIIVSPVVGGIVSIGIIIFFFCFIPKNFLKIPIKILNVLLRIMIIFSEAFKDFSINITKPSIISVIFIYGYFFLKIVINKNKKNLYKYLKFMRKVNLLEN